MKVHAYVDRHQIRGHVVDTIFLVEPTSEELAARKPHHDKIAGREGWVIAARCVIDTTGAPEELAQALAKFCGEVLPEPPREVRPPGELPKVNVSGVATMTPPAAGSTTEG